MEARERGKLLMQARKRHYLSQAEAACRQASLRDPQKDMEHSIRLWKEGITGARSLKSEQRFSESVTAYDTMETIWPTEQRIKDLRELTVHW